VRRARAVVSLLGEPPWPVLLTITLLGWVVVVGYGHGLAVSEFCVTATGQWLDRGWRELRAALFFVSPVHVAVSWLLMLVAMMTPLLAEPVRHLRLRSLARRRTRALVLFLAGYLAVWMAMAPVLVIAAVLIRVVAGNLGIAPLLPAAALALVWQASPWKQISLNRCHLTPRLAPFGWAADRDCLRFGVVNGLWCVGTCWALMLVPLVSHDGHLPLMALAAVILVAERLRAARPARWRIPLPGRLSA